MLEKTLSNRWEGAAELEEGGVLNLREWSRAPGLKCRMFLFSLNPAALAARHAAGSRKAAQTKPCPYMVITECSATSFVWAVGMCRASSTQWLVARTTAE